MRTQQRDDWYGMYLGLTSQFKMDSDWVFEAISEEVPVKVPVRLFNADGEAVSPVFGPVSGLCWNSLP